MPWQTVFRPYYSCRLITLLTKRAIVSEGWSRQLCCFCKRITFVESYLRVFTNKLYVTAPQCLRECHTHVPCHRHASCIHRGNNYFYKRSAFYDTHWHYLSPAYRFLEALLRKLYNWAAAFLHRCPDNVQLSNLRNGNILSGFETNKFRNQTRPVYKQRRYNNKQATIARWPAGGGVYYWRSSSPSYPGNFCN